VDLVQWTWCSGPGGIKKERIPAKVYALFLVS